jgi:hypothetical protein
MGVDCVVTALAGIDSTRGSIAQAWKSIKVEEYKSGRVKAVALPAIELGPGIALFG